MLSRDFFGSTEFQGQLEITRTFIRKISKEALRILGNEKNTKVRFILRCEMERASVATKTTIKEEDAFHSRVESNLQGDDENEIWREMTAESLEHMATFQRRGANWRFVRVMQAELHFADFNTLRAGTWIPLPASLRNKKALINMETQMIDVSCGASREL